MPAFPDTHRRLITGQIEVLANRMAQTITPSPALGYGDVMDMLSITGETRRILMDGRKLINVSATEANYTTVTVAEDVTLSIHVHGSNAPLMPRDAEVSLEFLMNDERGRAIFKRATQLAELSDDWGLVNHVFDKLNEHLTSPAQMRYVWPSVLALMSGVDSEATQALRSKLLPLKVPRELPGIPFELRALIRRASSVVSMSTLMAGVSPEARASTDVGLALYTGSHKKPAGYYTKTLRI